MSEYVYWAIEIGFLAYALKGRRQALMILALSMPFCRRMPALPIPLLNFENLLFILAIVVFLMDMPEKGAPGGKVRQWGSVLIIGLLATVGFINVLMTFEPEVFRRMWGTGYRMILSYKSFILCLGFYVIASLGVRSLEDLKGVMRFGVIGVILESAYTSFEYVVLSPGRATGHMGEPNSMGAYLAGSIGLLLALALMLPSGHRDRRYLWGGVAAAAIALLGTLSRTSLLAAGVGFIVLTSMVNRRILAAGLLFVSLNAIWLPARVQSRFDETFVAEDSLDWRWREGKGAENSVIISMINENMKERVARGEISEEEAVLNPSMMARFVVWEAAVRVMFDYPLGVGYGVFPWHLPYYTNVNIWKATHNIYMKLGAELGLPTLIAFLFLIVGLIGNSFRIGRNAEDPEVRAFGYGMFVYGLSLAVNALMVDVFFQTEVNGQFWIFMGALMQAPAILARSAAGRPEETDIPGEAGPAGEPEKAATEKPLYELV